MRQNNKLWWEKLLFFITMHKYFFPFISSHLLCVKFRKSRARPVNCHVHTAPFCEVPLLTFVLTFCTLRYLHLSRKTCTRSRWNNRSDFKRRNSVCFALQRKENTRRGGGWGGHECTFTLRRKSCLTPGNQISSSPVWAVYTFAYYLLRYTHHHQVGVTAALSCLRIEGRETIQAGVCPQERDNKTWHKRFEQSLTCKHMPERCIADLYIPQLVASPPCLGKDFT